MAMYPCWMCSQTIEANRPHIGHDVSSIAKGLFEMLENGVLRGKLSKLAVTNAARFSWDKATRDTLCVFEEAFEIRMKLNAT